MGIKYQDLAYANDKLAGCVVSWHNYPVYVEHIGDDGIAQVMKLGSHNVIGVQYEELDLTPVSLGNVNTPDGVYFVNRIPKRRDWRQGLRSNNMISTRVSGSANKIVSASNMLVNTILKVFPTLSDCIEVIENGEKVGCAFSKYFSVSTRDRIGYTLFYRTEKVGHIFVGVDGTLNPQLLEEFSYLNEMLQEEIKIGK